MVGFLQLAGRKRSVVGVVADHFHVEDHAVGANLPGHLLRRRGQRGGVVTPLAAIEDNPLAVGVDLEAPAILFRVGDALPAILLPGFLGVGDQDGAWGGAESS